MGRIDQDPQAVAGVILALDQRNGAEPDGPGVAVEVVPGQEDFDRRQNLRLRHQSFLS